MYCKSFLINFINFINFKLKKKLQLTNLSFGSFFFKNINIIFIIYKSHLPKIKFRTNINLTLQYFKV